MAKHRKRRIAPCGRKANGQIKACPAKRRKRRS